MAFFSAELHQLSPARGADFRTLIPERLSLKESACPVKSISCMCLSGMILRANGLGVVDSGRIFRARRRAARPSRAAATSAALHLPSGLDYV